MSALGSQYWKSVCRHLGTAGLVGVMLALCLVCLPLFAQTGQGNIQGGVFDQSGGAVAGATVTVTDVARGVARTLIAVARHLFGSRRSQRLQGGAAQRRAARSG
jgi:hypothetical protein